MSELISNKSEKNNKVKIEQAIKHLELICDWSLYKDHPIGVNAKQALDLLRSIDKLDNTN